MNNALALLSWERVGQGETRKPCPTKMSKNRIILVGFSCLTSVKVYYLKGFMSTAN